MRHEIMPRLLQGTRMRPRTSGFTLTELVIVITIVAILSAMVVSAYQTYTARAQVADALTLATEAMTAVSASFQATGVAPANRQAAGMPTAATDTPGRFVLDIAVRDGRLDIVFGKDSHLAIFGEHLSITPYLTGDGAIAWRCGLAPAPPGAELLPEGANHSAPSVELRYLPAACRP